MYAKYNLYMLYAALTLQAKLATHSQYQYVVVYYSQFSAKKHVLIQEDTYKYEEWEGKATT